jgi:cold shock CspA family protein
MRHQGRITEWKDDRGFGFITPNGGGNKVFLHFRSLRKGEPRPAGGELVTYELAPAGDKGPRAENVTYVDRPQVAPRASAGPSRGRSTGSRGMTITIMAALLIMIAGYVWQKFDDRKSARQRTDNTAETGAVSASPQMPATPKSTALVEQLTPGSTSSAFKCEGKKYCSQMTSCAEAKFYLKNCPGAEIDGDGDGIPCERQHCKG